MRLLVERSFGTAVPVLLVLVACATPATDDWTDQLVADGACFRVDLFDGLDEETSAELHDLYGCLNRTGDFDAVGPIVESLDGEAPSGQPAWREAAVAVNALAEAGIDPFALAGVLLDALRAPERPLDLALDVALELIYGVPADTASDANEPSEGLLAPLAPLVAPVAGALRADDRALATWAGDVLADPATPRWIRTIESFATSADPEVEAPVSALPADLTAARAATLDASNDRWTGASGDSLRDAFDAWVTAPSPVLSAIAADASRILADEGARAGLERGLVGLAEDGTLGRAADGAEWMSSVDSDALPLDPGEDSALHAFVRLLADANQPMDCSIDLIFFDLTFSFGNLAVSTLELIADVDPETLQSAGSIYGLLFGNDVGEFILEEAADLGVCPGLTRQLVEDLGAVEVLAQPPAESLLTALVAVLDSLEEGDENQIPAFADLADALYGAGGWPATEELVRDAATTALADDALLLLPALSDPASHGITAGNEPAVDLAEAVDLLAWVVDVDPATGETGFDRIEVLLEIVGTADGTWLALDRGIALVGDPTSRLGSGTSLVTGLLAADPDLVLVGWLAPLLGEPAIAEPVLQVLETPGVGEAAFAGAPHAGQAEAPLDFAGRLVYDGTFADLLLVLDLALGLLGSPG